MLSTVISVYSIFIILFLSSAIKNLVSNSNGYSRYLRIRIVFVVFGYLIFVIFLAIKPLLKGYNASEKSSNILSMVTFFLSSVLSLGTLINMDFKRESVRDLWKYNSVSFKNFKTEKPTSKWNWGLVSLITVILILIIALSISMMVVDNSCWMRVAYGVLIAHILINYLFYGPRRDEIRKDTSRYNLLKSIILNKPKGISATTYMEVGIKALKLYKKIFINSYHYKKNVHTNNAIVYEIIKRTGAKVEEKEYLFDFDDKTLGIDILKYEKIMGDYHNKIIKNKIINKFLDIWKRYSKENDKNIKRNKTKY